MAGGGWEWPGVGLQATPGPTKWPPPATGWGAPTLPSLGVAAASQEVGGGARPHLCFFVFYFILFLFLFYFKKISLFIYFLINLYFFY
jgi:hypothetical protein